MLALVFGALIAITIATLIFLGGNYCQNKSSDLPGPWKFPFLGHLLSLGSHSETTLTNWKNIYGPIYSIKLATFPAVVLNDANIIKEALGLDAFTGRPAILNLVSASELKGFTFNDGPRNLEQREFAVKTLQRLRLVKTEHENRIQKEIGAFLHLFKTKCKSASLAASDNTRNIFTQISMFFPPISRILNFLGMNKILNANNQIRAFVNQEIQKCKDDYVPKQPKHFTHAYFDKIAETQNPNSSFHASADESEQVISTRELLFGAIDTTVTELDWVLFYMASHFDIQQKLQQEIDNVLNTFSVSEGRAPCLLDQAYMPYTVAVINESLRISTITPTSVYHRTLEDVYLRGYKIPKDTIVIPNLYAVHHDPETWPDPDKFIPERFLESDGTPNKSARDTLPFGFGKRKCIGENIARDQLFLFVTSFFQHFCVQHPGAIPPANQKFSMIVAPQKFDLLISERFASVIDPINSKLHDV